MGQNLPMRIHAKRCASARIRIYSGIFRIYAHYPHHSAFAATPWSSLMGMHGDISSFMLPSTTHNTKHGLDQCTLFDWGKMQFLFDNNFRPVCFIKLVEAVVLPLQWSHAYLSLDSFASKVTLEVGMVEWKWVELMIKCKLFWQQFQISRLLMNYVNCNQYIQMFFDTFE